MWPANEIDPRVGLDRANCCNDQANVCQENTVSNLLNKKIITRIERISTGREAL